MSNPFEDPIDSSSLGSTGPTFGQTQPLSPSRAPTNYSQGHLDLEAQLPQQQGFLASSPHPTAVIFHLLFKCLAITTYLLCGFIFDNFILVFVVCVLLLSFDFWTVKNVTGRLLVGLRWWNEVKDDGTTSWIFESKPDNRLVHPTDSLVFWVTLYATPLVWGLLGLAAFIGFKFQWLLIVVVAIVLSGANVVGFWKCQKDAKQKIQSFIFQRMMNSATNQGTGVSI